MALTIDETIQLQAPPDRTWTALQDAQLIVRCLPGAKLVRMVHERKFVNQMKAKLGSVRVVYKGDLEITELHEEEQRMVVAGKWNERGGSGSAKLHMDITLKEMDGGSEVAFKGQVDIVGRMVQFARGMMSSVSDELFKQFAKKMKAELESAQEEAESAPTAPPSAETSAAGAAGQTQSQQQSQTSSTQLPVIAGTAETAAGTPTTAASTAEAAALEAAKAAAEAARAAAVAAQAAKAAAEASQAVARALVARHEEEEEEDGLNVVALTFKAMWNSISSFFQGLFGPRAS